MLSHLEYPVDQTTGNYEHEQTIHVITCDRKYFKRCLENITEALKEIS